MLRRRILCGYFLFNGELDAPGEWIGWKFKVHYIHRRQFTRPGRQCFFARGVGADFPQYGGQVFAAIPQHYLPGESGLAHQFGYEVEEAHLSECRGDLLGVFFVPPYYAPVFLKLGKGRLVMAHRDAISVLALASGFFHPEEQVQVIILVTNRVRPFRMGGINRVFYSVNARPCESLSNNPEHSGARCIAANINAVGIARQSDLQGESRFLEANHFRCGAANPVPFDLAADAVLAAQNLRQAVTAADAVEEAKGVADIALAAGVGANYYGERPDAQRLVSEVLEINQAQGSNHDGPPAALISLSRWRTWAASPAERL